MPLTSGAAGQRLHPLQQGQMVKPLDQPGSLPGHNLRALVEADIDHLKRVIGAASRSLSARRQATEVVIPTDVLSRMLGLGRPADVRII